MALRCGWEGPTAIPRSGCALAAEVAGGGHLSGASCGRSVPGGEATLPGWGRSASRRAGGTACFLEAAPVSSGGGARGPCSPTPCALPPLQLPERPGLSRLPARAPGQPGRLGRQDLAPWRAGARLHIQPRACRSCPSSSWSLLCRPWRFPLRRCAFSPAFPSELRSRGLPRPLRSNCLTSDAGDLGGDPRTGSSVSSHAPGPRGRCLCDGRLSSH